MNGNTVFKLEMPELPALLKKLREVGGNTLAKKAVRKGLKAGSKLMQATAKQLAPKYAGKYPKSRVDRKPGTLRKNIRSMAMRRSRQRFGYVVSAGLRGKNINSGEAYYGLFVEKGGPKRRAIPFMRPAFDRHKDATVALVMGSVRTTLESLWVRK